MPKILNLKPCPFCGDLPLDHNEVKGDPDLCGCITEGCALNGKAFTKKEWNKRLVSSSEILNDDFQKELIIILGNIPEEGINIMEPKKYSTIRIEPSLDQKLTEPWIVYADSRSGQIKFEKVESTVCKKCDAEMLRIKACEHIAEGDEGWEKLRNICPSTMLVATLRDKYEASLKRELINSEELAKQHWNYANHGSDGNRPWHNLNKREQGILITQMQTAINSIEVQEGTK